MSPRGSAELWVASQCSRILPHERRMGAFLSLKRKKPSIVQVPLMENNMTCSNVSVPLIEITASPISYVFLKILIPYSRFPIHVFLKRLIPSSRFSKVAISCFVEDIGPIFTIFKNVLNGSSGFFRAPPFPTISNF